MEFFDKLMGKEPSSAPAAKRSVEELRKDPNLIRVFDKYGQELFITKEQWRTNILPGSIRTNWDDPDKLYGVIFTAFNDGFFAEVAGAAEQLYKTDKEWSRGTCVWGIVLLKQGRLDEAEKVFKESMARHGEVGSVLTNLAKVYSQRKDAAQAESTLWHALELDPNQENGLAWYHAIHHERGGEQAGLAALRRVAVLPNSWRAQLWLARAALKDKDKEVAMHIYQDCLSKVGKPIPADLLRQISGDLGIAGYLPEMLALVEPQFIAASHGLQVGNNLIKAHVDLGQFDDAYRILNQLYALNRLDLKDGLGFWDTAIAKAKIAASPAPAQAALKMGILSIAGPVWLKPDSPAAPLFDGKPAGTPLISFIGSSAELATDTSQVQRQLADAPGRMSRSLPLFLAEQTAFRTRARSITLVPWVTEPNAGFALSGVTWTDSNAAKYSREGGILSEYVVVAHLNARAEPWVAEVRVIRSADGQCLGRFSESFSIAAPAEAVLKLADRLLELLTGAAKIEPQTPPPLYRLPTAATFPTYMLRLEQLLAIRCASMRGVRADFLHGERDIIDGNIQQCLAAPASASTRLLLAQTLLAMKRVRPDILPEFKDRLALIQKEHPLQEPAQGLIQKLFDEALHPSP